MKSQLLITAGAIALITAGTAAAGQGEQGTERPGALPESPHQAQVTQGAIPVGFDDLDINQDGKISKTEAKDYPDLLEKWSKLNTDQDDTLEQAEFAEFQQPLNKSGGQ